MCVCSLKYPACNAHAPYCHLWPDTFYIIFPSYLINGRVFEKKILNTKCVFWISLQLLSEIFLVLRINEWDMIKMYTGLLVKYPSFLSDFNEIWIFSTDFWKIPKYQISQNPSSGSLIVPWGRTNRWTDGRTDRHDEANSRFSQFGERASKLEIYGPTNYIIIKFRDFEKSKLSFLLLKRQSYVSE